MFSYNVFLLFYFLFFVSRPMNSAEWRRVHLYFSLLGTESSALRTGCHLCCYGSHWENVMSLILHYAVHCVKSVSIYWTSNYTRNATLTCNLDFSQCRVCIASILRNLGNTLVAWDCPIWFSLGGGASVLSSARWRACILQVETQPECVPCYLLSFSSSRASRSSLLRLRTSSFVLLSGRRLLLSLIPDALAEIWALTL